MIAALYVETGGAYYGLPDVDPWDKDRDARQYNGPWPVVAHPPCNRWSSLAPLVQHVHGYRVGDDGGTFAAALLAVRRFGGVLEHPAGTRAWSAFGLPRPSTRGGWTVTLDGEAVCYVEQRVYGHAGRKPTWLYASGCDLLPLRWSNTLLYADDAAFYCGKHGQRPIGAARLRGVRASASPPAFRDALLALARTAIPSLAIIGDGLLTGAD